MKLLGNSKQNCGSIDLAAHIRYVLYDVEIWAHVEPLHYIDSCRHSGSWNPSSCKTGTYRATASTSLMLIYWRRNYPGHQQPWYWFFETDKFGARTLRLTLDIPICSINTHFNHFGRHKFIAISLSSLYIYIMQIATKQSNSSISPKSYIMTLRYWCAFLWFEGIIMDGCVAQ